jgi:hypothetical protein
LQHVKLASSKRQRTKTKREIGHDAETIMPLYRQLPGNVAERPGRQLGGLKMHLWIKDFAVGLVAAADLSVIVVLVAMFLAVWTDVNHPTSRPDSR